MNVIAISGNLTKDAEVKTLNAGKQVLSFNIAHNISVNKNGNWEQIPNYYKVTSFSEYHAKKAADLTKGTKVCVQGKLSQNKYTKDGKEYTYMEILASEIEFTPKQEASQGKPKGQPIGDIDTDVPF